MHKYDHRHSIGKVRLLFNRRNDTKAYIIASVLSPYQVIELIFVPLLLVAVPPNRRDVQHA